MQVPCDNDSKSRLSQNLGLTVETKLCVYKFLRVMWTEYVQNDP